MSPQNGRGVRVVVAIDDGDDDNGGGDITKER